MRRGLAVSLVLAAAAAAAALGWAAGQRIRSPAQVALSAEPPAPSLITVEVELTELAADVITRADVGYDDPASLSLNGSLGGRPPVLLVTSAPERGDDLAEGSAAIEISGRPVFLLAGEIPVFRDLRPNTRGPDVLQVEQALARLGFFGGEPDEEWNSDTGEAVTAWYEAAGYIPNGVTDEEKDRLETARDQVKTAQDGVRTAQDRIDSAEDEVEDRLETARDQVKTAQDGIVTAQDRIDSAEDEVEGQLEAARDQVKTAEDGIVTAQERAAAAARNRKKADDALTKAKDDLADAEQDLARARQGPDDLEIQRARSALASAEEQIRFTEADAEKATAEAERAVSAAQAERNEAANAYSSALARWESAQTGVHPDGGTLPTPSQMEVLRLASENAGLALETAERGITEAESARDRKRVENAAALRTAGDNLAAAQKALDDLLAPPDVEQQIDAVEEARTAVENARTGIDEAQSALMKAQNGLADAQEDLAKAQDGLADAQADAPKDLAKAQDGLADAQEDLADARADLADAQADAPKDLAKAQDGLADAQEDLADARADLADAQADAQEDLAKAQDGLAAAQEDLAKARADLAELESETGVWIPAGELIFLERLPVRVDRLTAERGSTVSGSFMTVTGSELAVRGSVLVRDVSLVKEGGEALIDDPLLADPLAGEIRLVADRPGTHNVAADRHYLEVVAEGIPGDLVGSNVKVIIPVGGTGGEVLAVPAAALSATADGSARVEVEQPGGSTRFVAVEPGLAASGLVEVTPLDGELQEGDLVVVGVAGG